MPLVVITISQVIFFCVCTRAVALAVAVNDARLSTDDDEDDDVNNTLIKKNNDDAVILLKLDTQIRDYVLIPITIAMFFVGVIRHNISKIAQIEKKVERDGLREAQAVVRAERIRLNSGYLSNEGFERRRVYFCNNVDGVFSQESKKSNVQQQMLSDPSMLSEMLTKNLNMIVPNMLTMAWVNFFFTGFVVGKVPFPLTQRFRGMLQRGVDLKSLDVTYVSSLSWYFLNFFGLGGVFGLVLGNNTLNDAQQMKQMSMMGMDTNKAFKQVKENLEMIAHESTIEEIAERRATIILRELNNGKTKMQARKLALER